MKEIPIFFATDNNYAPFLAVTLKSIFENSSKDYFYRIYVMTSNLHDDLRKRISKVMVENSSIEYVDINSKLETIKSKLHLRDYYSMETYFRFFIADMFPQFDKVIYLDCDIVVVGDIADFYNTHISNYLVAAVKDQVFEKYKCFSDYANKVLGLRTKKVFNAGVLLMNTKLFRAYKVLDKFTNLLSFYKFRVTQDEDYLNVICKDKVKYLNVGWNKMPFDNTELNKKKLKLIHYNLSLKPWHYDNIMYGDLFWKYAQMTDFYEDISLQLKYYSDEKKQKDDIVFDRLKNIALEDTASPDNYKNLVKRAQKGKIFKKTYKQIRRIPIIKSIHRIIVSNSSKISYEVKNHNEN